MGAMIRASTLDKEQIIVYDDTDIDDLRRRIELLEQRVNTGAAGEAHIIDWLKERCTLKQGARTTSADLYDDYADWCREVDREPLPPTSARFARALRAYGLGRWRNASGRGFEGIEITELDW